MKTYYTALIEYDRPEDMPLVRAGMKALGGKVIAVHFDDMFKELERIEAECDALRAELDRLTTLRPASEHDTQNEALWWHSPDDFHGASYFRDAPYWTPLPDVKEAK